MGLGKNKMFSSFIFSSNNIAGQNGVNVTLQKRSTEAELLRHASGNLFLPASSLQRAGSSIAQQLLSADGQFVLAELHCRRSAAE